jgi:hypothetical protein
MSYFRSYFEKNNTIIKDSRVNTSKNPTTEIFYGSGFSKFIFKINFDDIIEKVERGDLVLNNSTKHYLRLTNTIFGNETFLNAKRGTGRQRATSFDLILFKINESWDEGTGFDYEDEEYDYTLGNKTFDQRPSNWFNRTSLNTWSVDGVYDINPDIVQTIHFDNGNENINVDITSYVNGIINGTIVNHGLGLAFSVAFQDIVNLELDQSVSFFTKYTQTYFEPYVESIFYDRINDDRHDFTENVEQNLILYVKKGANYYNLNIPPAVDIYDHTNTLVDGLQDIVSEKVRKGVYRISFGLSGFNCDGKKFFYDKWKNLEIDTVVVSDITQKFIPRPMMSYYSLGPNDTDFKRYSIQFYGIKQNEKVKPGEIRKIGVIFKHINSPLPVIQEEVYYRMFIKEGRTDVIVHDWTQLDVTNENSFMIDTSIYVPREYYIEIKANINGEEIFYEEYIKFEIISQK